MPSLDLAGIWSLSSPEFCSEPLPVAIPGDNYTALLAAAKIPDPYVGNNENCVQWVAQYDWSFAREFEVSELLLHHDAVLLGIDAIDTVAEILINGQSAGHSCNMFLRFRRDIKALLHAGINQIEIRIVSPIKAVKTELAKQKLDLLANCGPEMKIPGLNLIRKSICHSGWDWGISLPVSGIYGDISLAGVDTAILESVETVQQHTDGRCVVAVTARLTALIEKTLPLDFEFAGQHRVVKIRLHPGCNQATAEFTVESPALWYPVGYGDQPLYPLRVATPQMVIAKRLGLRTMELRQQPDDVGVTMTFVVNGIEIFCKGADWIPCDAFPSRQTQEQYRRLIHDAAEANMNMLRVWGGGQYEQDIFYDLCDETGILVWQDCMFACQLYPSDRKFLTLVKQEIDYQLHRLRDHACIALWCGDNECTCYFCWDVSGKLPYLLNYDRLNQAVAEAVAEADPTRAFWPSSPCNGPMDFVGSWHDDSRGDMHFWEVWHGGKSFEEYYKVTPRFCSEFGYQAFPSLNTIARYAQPEDYNLTSPVIEHHQKNVSGNSKILEMFSRYFRIPEGFENFIYLSQVQQAQAIRTGVEYWRWRKPQCMGTLYWQFNDNWPVASWSSIDYFGHWKQLHYHAKRFYAPVMAGCFRQDNRCDCFVVSDWGKPCRGTLTVRLLDWAGNEQHCRRFAVEINARSSMTVAQLELADWIQSPTDGFLHLELAVGDGVKEWQHSGEYFLTQYKHCELQNPEISIEVVDDRTLQLRAKRPAFFVFLELRDCRCVFSDNSFTLLPDRPCTVTLRTDEAMPMPEILSRLRVNHLWQSYQKSQQSCLAIINPPQKGA